VGNGDGTFKLEQTLTDTDLGDDLISADFNEDGIPDLVSGNGSSISVLLNMSGATIPVTQSNVTVDAGSIATHVLQCSYGGDANYAPSNSGTVTETYPQTSTPVFPLLVGIYPPGQHVSITDGIQGATIRYTTDGSIPTMNSNLYSSPITLNQTTTLKAAAFATGYMDSLVSTAAYTIQTSGGTFSLNSPSVSVMKGAAGTSSVAVSTSDQYVGVVTLSCAVTSSPAGAVHLPTCSASQTVTLTSLATTGTATLALRTTPASSTGLARPSQPKSFPFATGGGIVLASIVLIMVPRGNKARRLLLLLMGVAIITVDFGACGGGGSGSPRKSDPGTTPGAYTITVTGTGSDTAKSTASTTFTLTVQ